MVRLPSRLNPHPQKRTPGTDSVTEQERTTETHTNEVSELLTVSPIRQTER